MKRFLILFLFLIKAHAIEFKWYGAPEMKIHEQPLWTLYFGDEASIGAARVKGSTGSPPVGVLSADAYALASTANAPLPNIPIGTYRVWVSYYAYTTRRGNLWIQCAAGGTTSGAVVNESDPDGSWANLGVITVPAPIDRLNLLFYCTNAMTGQVVFPGTLVAIYMNTDTNLVMNKDGYAQNWNLSAATDASAAIPGNYIFNSSFELCPSDTAVTILSNDGRTYTLDDCWKSGGAFHGDKYLSVIMDRCATTIAPTWVNVPSMHFRPDKKHTMSVYARCSATPATVQLAMRNNNTTPPEGYGLPAQPVVQSAIHSLTTNWQRYTLPDVTLRAYPYSDFSPELFITATTGSRVEFDAWQLEEGSAPTAYAAAYAREMAMTSDAMANIYYDDEGPPSINFTVMENGTAGTDTINYALYHGAGDLVQASSMSHTTTNGVVTSSLVQFAVTKYGPYRIVAWLSSNGLRVENHFTLIRRPRNVSWDDRRIGTDPQGSHINMQILDRLGMRALRLLSPGNQFRWAFGEPTPGVYFFNDEFTEAHSQYDFVTLGNIYQECAAWAQRVTVTLTNVVGPGFQVGETVTQGAVSGKVTWVSSPTGPLRNAIQITNKLGGDFGTTGSIVGGTSGTTADGNPIQTFNEGIQVRKSRVQNHLTADIVRYAQYCGAVAAHYTNIVYWEVWNEPGAGFGSVMQSPTNSEITDSGMAFYSEHVILAVDAIRAANPNAKICVPGGMTIDSAVTNRLDMMWNALPTATRDKIDLINYHIYPNAGSFSTVTRNYATARGKDSWDTEAGWEDFGNRLGWMAPWYYLGYPMQPYTYIDGETRSVSGVPQMVSTNIMEVLGAGHTKYFYYDCRHFHTSKNTINHYTMMDGDDTVKPKTAVCAWFEYLCAGGVGMGQIPISGSPPHARAYRYDDGWDDKDYIFLFAANGEYNLNWGINFNQVEVYDMYGNKITTSGFNIPFGKGGVIIKGTTVDGAAMASAIGSGSSVSATADTTAPNLIWQDFPPTTIRPVESSRALARWIAYDNGSVTQAAKPNAMLYRSRVNGGTWSPWSSDTFIQWYNPASGSYTVDVEAMDEALNPASITGTFAVP